MNPINVGIIGNGMATQVFHIPVIGSVLSLRLKKIVDRHGSQPPRRFPLVEIVPNTTTLLQDDEVELVVIATPNGSHFDLAKQAILAHKHVVVEKPFTATSAQARQLIGLAQEHDRILSVHQNRRWDGDFITIKKLLDGGVLGRLVEYESHFDRFRNVARQSAWREQSIDGGILFDLGSHLIDQALILFGLPKTVTADIRKQRKFGNADDYFEVILHYDSLKVTLKAGMLALGPNQRFILRGECGSFIKLGLDIQEDALKKGGVPSDLSWGEEPQDLWGTLYTQKDGVNVEKRIKTELGCYQAFYENLAAVICGRAKLAVTPQDALNTIRIIELANASAAAQRTFPFDSE